MDIFTLAYIKGMMKDVHADCEGTPGKSAYEIAVENGLTENEIDIFAKLEFYKKLPSGSFLF